MLFKLCDCKILQRLPLLTHCRQTYDLAEGGAVTGIALGYKNNFPAQMTTKFEAKYLNPGAGWDPSKTLFSTFFGINDIGFGLDTVSSLKVYGALLDQLYKYGARNFLILNVPPLERAPVAVQAGQQSIEQHARAVSDWNRLLAPVAQNLSATYPDVKAFVYDTYSLFNEILNSPSSNKETAGLKNTTTYCQTYSDHPTTKNAPECGVPEDEYFWLNGLHPVWPMHHALAESVARILG